MFRALRPLALLACLAGCDAAVPGSAYLDIGPESEPAAVQAALRAAHPPGGDAAPLLAALRGRFAAQPMAVTHDIVIDGENLTGHAFRHVVQREAGNADHWVFRILVAPDERLRQATVRRYFRDSDFAARGRPFAFADFERAGDAEAALRSLIGAGWNAAEVADVMRGAGAEAGKGTSATYDYRGQQDAPWPLPPRWEATWRFGETGHATAVAVKAVRR